MTPAPVGPANGLIRSGCKSTWAPPPTITSVVLQWEAQGAYGKAYQIQTSPDGTTWTPIYSTTSGAGGTETLTVSGTGRYVRMNGTARGTGYGYSLWEFQVYGALGTSTPTTPPTTSPTTAPTTPPATIPGNFTTLWQDSFDGAANTSPSSAQLAAADRHLVPGRRRQLGHQ